MIYLGFITFLAYTSVKNTEDDLVLRRWNFNGKTVEVPFHLYTDSPTVVVFETVFEFDSKKAYLILPHIHTQAIEVYLNGERIFSLGNENGYCDFDSITLSVPLDLREGKNVLDLKLISIADLHLDWPPYVVEKPDFRVPLSNFLFSFMNLVAVGSLLLIFVYTLIMGVIRRRAYYTMFGLSFLSIAFYMVNYTFNAIPVNGESYIAWTKFLNSSAFVFLPFMAAGFNLIVEGRVRKRTFVLIAVGFSLAAGTFFHSPYRYVETTSFYFPAVALYGFFETLREKYWEFKVGSLIALASVVQHFLYVIHVSPIPSLMGHGVMTALVIFATFLSTEFSNVERELMRTRKELFIDPLTGAFNRRILDILDVSSSDAVVFFDLDDFKKINDEKGHEYGDEILRKFVSTVKDVVRKDDILVRYGGDEFVLVLRGCDLEKAQEIAQAIKNSMVNETGASVSYGISGVETSLREAISRSDKLMYEMKKLKLSKAS